jgi:hypothetical protein
MKEQITNKQLEELSHMIAKEVDGSESLTSLKDGIIELNKRLGVIENDVDFTKNELTEKNEELQEEVEDLNNMTLTKLQVFINNKFKKQKEEDEIDDVAGVPSKGKGISKLYSLMANKFKTDMSMNKKILKKITSLAVTPFKFFAGLLGIGILTSAIHGALEGLLGKDLESFKDVMDNRGELKELIIDNVIVGLNAIMGPGTVFDQVMGKLYSILIGGSIAGATIAGARVGGLPGGVIGFLSSVLGASLFDDAKKKAEIEAGIREYTRSPEERERLLNQGEKAQLYSPMVGYGPMGAGMGPYMAFESAANQSQLVGDADSAIGAKLFNEVSKINQKLDEGATGGNVNNITVNEAPDEVMNYEADN